MAAGDIIGLLVAAAAAATPVDDDDVSDLLLSGRSRPPLSSSDSGDDDRWLNEDRSGDTQRMTPPLPPLTLAVAAAAIEGTTRHAMAM